MAREDVRSALEAMFEDEATRERLASGAFNEPELAAMSSDEQQMVQDAAQDMPDVSGFGMRLSAVDGESTDDKHKNQIEIVSWSLGATMPLKWQSAVRYGFNT